MAKCKECGFLAIWRYVPRELSEAHEDFRETGKLETDISEDGRQYYPKCFMRRAPLQGEVLAIIQRGQVTSQAVLNVINYERECNYVTQWIQGFSPKEHREMLDREELYRDRQKHDWRTLVVAILGALASAIGILVGANINLKAAQIQADAQDRSTKQQIEAQKQLLQMQIDSQKEASRQVPPINLTVQIPPDNKQGKKKEGP